MAGRTWSSPPPRSGRATSSMTFTALLRRLGIPAVPHGFRSSFRDWVIEQTSTPWAVAEAALAHNVGNSTEAATCGPTYSTRGVRSWTLGLNLLPAEDNQWMNSFPKRTATY